VFDDGDVEVGEPVVDDRVPRSAAEDHEIVMAHGCEVRRPGSGNNGDGGSVDVGA
jgi:hypothetical protein